MNHEAEDSQDQADAAILAVDIDDAAIEIAASGVGTIPTASVNMVPPNCCVQRPARKPE
jgi:chemotaxis methyl-accepting protein methylase